MTDAASRTAGPPPGRCRARDLGIGAGPLLTRIVLSDEYVDPSFAAAVEATEEACIDSLVAADTVVGRDGNRVPGLPLGRVVELLRSAGRSAALPTGLV